VSKPRAGAAVWIATCAGAGYFPIAPGTAGALVGVALVAAAARLPLGHRALVALVGGTALALCALGVWAAGRAEKHFGCVDPSQVVLDEVVGQMLTLLLRPAGSWKWLLAGFLLFRFFDVLKPFPARRAEHAPAGWGIMLDDVVAGLYGLAAMVIAGLIFK
jgi:phosphatidylglycerophosphatase A